MRTALAVAVLVATADAATAASGSFLLIRRDHPVQLVEIAEISPRRLVYRHDASGWIRAPIDECVALLDPAAIIVPRRQGWLQLADGQRFPGEALSGAKAAEHVLVWNQSSWIGRMEVALDRIESVTFVAGATVPAAGDADVLALANGDLLEGFVTALGDPVTLELLNGASAGESTVYLPLSRVDAVRMVTPPPHSAGRRVWLDDGTVVDVSEVVLGDDGYVRLGDNPFASDQQPKTMELSVVVAILFDQDGLVPFASMRPRRVTGPPTRFVVPDPEVLDDLAPLGLARVEFQGPLSVRYNLPQGATFFSAEARLPLASRTFGDCEIVIRNEGREIFSTRLNADHPSAVIGAAVRGTGLTIQVTEGSAGPIQDQVVLHNALVLVDR